VPWVPTTNHADAVLIEAITINLQMASQEDGYVLEKGTCEYTDANESIDIGKISGDIVLGGVEEPN